MSHSNSPSVCSLITHALTWRRLFAVLCKHTVMHRLMQTHSELNHIGFFLHGEPVVCLFTGRCHDFWISEIFLFRVQPRSSPSFVFATQTPQLQGLITHQVMQITFSYSCRYLSLLPSRHTYLHCTSCGADKYISSALQWWSKKTLNWIVEREASVRSKWDWPTRLSAALNNYHLFIPPVEEIDFAKWTLTCWALTFTLKEEHYL